MFQTKHTGAYQPSPYLGSFHAILPHGTAHRAVVEPSGQRQRGEEKDLWRVRSGAEHTHVFLYRETRVGLCQT